MALLVGQNATALRYIEELITEGGMQPGDQLPTERELSAAAGVSRAVIRTALDSLQERGMVIRHVGRGTFLAPSTESVLDEGGSHPSPAQIMAARLVIEPELLALAVSTATRPDIDAMRRCLEGGANASSFEEFEHWDIQLHHSFAVATHNSVLINASRLLIEAREEPIWGSLKRRTFTPALKVDYCCEHSQIVAAIEDLDPQAARSAMRDHLRHIRMVLLGPDG